MENIISFTVSSSQGRLYKKVPQGSGTYKFGSAEFSVVSQYVVALENSYSLKVPRVLTLLAAALFGSARFVYRLGKLDIRKKDSV